MKRIRLVRHEHSRSQGGADTGTDPCMSGRGRQQATRLRDRLGSIRFDHVLISPLKRARETFELSGLAGPLLVLALSFPSAHLAFAAEPAKKLTDVTYTYSKMPLSNRKDQGDAGLTKLVNGKLEDSDTGMLWNKMRMGTIVLNFDLKGRYMVHKVIGKGYRGGPYSWRHFKLELEDEAGFETVGVRDVGGDDQRTRETAVHPVLDINKPARRLRVSCGTDSNYIWIQEIEIFASKIPPRSPIARPGGTGPRPNITYFLPPMPPGQELFYEEADFDADGAPELLVENKVLRLVLEPKLGGRIGSFVYKPTRHDFTVRPDPGVPGGLLGDHEQKQGYWGDWIEADYDYQVEQNDNEIAVHLSAAGKTGALQFITFNKTVRLRPGSSALKVDYLIENSFRSVTPLTYGFWFHNMALGPRGASAFFLPSMSGIRQANLTTATDEIRLRDPARGWIAGLARNNQTGLSVALDYRYFNLFSSWLGNLSVPTMDFKLHPVKIDAGSRFKTSLTYLAFRGLNSVAGAAAELAGSLEIIPAPDKIHTGISLTLCASLVAAKPMNLELICTATHLPDGEITPLGRTRISVPRIGPATAQFSFKPSQPGTYAALVEVRADDRTLCRLEKAVIVGQPTAKYVLIPSEPQITLEKTAPKMLDLRANSQQVVTPHVDWASPYAGKRLRALIFADDRGMRDIVELQQRMDIDVETSFLTHLDPQEGLGDYWNDITTELLVKRAHELFNKQYDVVVLSGSVWNLLGDKLKEKVRQWTQKGVGIVYISPVETGGADWSVLPVAQGKGRSWMNWNPAAPHPITSGVPLEILPTTRFSLLGQPKGKVIATVSKERLPGIVVGQTANSRVAVLGYETCVGYKGKAMPISSLTPTYYELNSDPATMDHWEYTHSLLAKTILWAARADRSVQLTSVQSRDPVNITSAQRALILLSLQSKEARSVTLLAAVHQGFRPRIYLEPIQFSLEPGQNQLTLPVPTTELLDGDNLVDFWIKQSDQRVLEWGTAVVKAIAPMRIAGISLDSDWFAPGKPVTGKVDIIADRLLPDSWLRLSVADGQGRVLWRKKLRPVSGALTFAAPVDEPLISANRIHAEIGQAQQTLAADWKRFTIPTSRDWDDFDACVWGVGAWRAARMYTVPTAAAMLRKAGFTSIILNPWDHMHYDYIDALSSQGLRFTVKGGGLGRPGVVKGSDPKHPVRNTNPIADKVLESSRNIGKSMTETGPKYGVLDFMIGDENAWHGEWSDFYLQKFRNWLQKQYRTIAALNDEWSSDFTDFNSVMPLNAQEARTTGHYPRWVDFKRFDAHAFATYFGTMRNEMKRGDRQGRISLSGTQTPRSTNGYDWEILANNLDVARCYGRFQQSLIRSMNPKAITARWTGYGFKEDRLYWWTWQRILEGGAGLSNCLERQILNPDLTLSKSGKMFAKAHRQMSRGIVKALIHAKRSGQSVLLHYSYPSHCVANLLNCEFELNASRTGFIDSLEGHGTQHRFASGSQIEKGLLGDPQYRMLILTQSFALCDTEAAPIRRFVHNGGVVLADLRPGITDEHGKKRPRGLLDDLLGVNAAKAKFTLEKTSLKSRAAIDGLTFGKNQVTTTAIELGLIPTTAKSAGFDPATRTPVLLVNRVGKGAAILLNCNIFADYGKFAPGRNLPGSSQKVALLDNITAAAIKLAGIKPIVQLTADDAQPVPLKYFARFDAGQKVTYLGILHRGKPSDPTRMATLKLPAHYNVYDILAGIPTASTDTVRFPIPGIMAKILALTPYSVTAIETDLPAVARTGRTVHFRVAINASETPDNHVVRMEVTGPDDKERWYLAKNILVPPGGAQITLPFALNDHAGAWTVRFHDITSGKKLEKTVQLMGRNKQGASVTRDGLY